MGAGKTRGRLGRMLAVTAAAAAVVLGGLPALAGPASRAPAGPGAVTPPPLPGSRAAAALRARHHLGAPPATKFVPGYHAPRVVPAAAVRPGQLARPAPAPAWPAAGRVMTAVAATSAQHAVGRSAGRGRWQRAGRFPVWIAPTIPAGTAAAGRAVAAAGGPSRVAVTMSGHRMALAAGANGLLFSIIRADGVSAPGRVGVRVSYAGFASAYGGGYGARLALFAMPACALTTPARPACRGMTPMRSVNNWKTRTVSAVVTAGASPGRAAVLALSSTTSDGTGDFKATSLAPSSQWQVGLQTGDFAWSYPLRVPPGIGGAVPKLTLSYDSGATDGETAQDNSQPGQVGEGFSLAGAGGFIERRYVSCGDLISGKVTGSHNDTDQTFATGDECWDGYNAYLSFGGHSTELVLDHTTQTWHLGSDDGSTVKFLSGASNGSYNGRYWEIITPDGTQYYYGLGELPGWQQGNTVTNSVWTMPVFGLGSGDPCHTSSYATSYCPNMPWRWNLDLVVDPNGNATSYYYSAQTNYYATDSYTDSSFTTHYGTALPYTSGGTLNTIWYGMQDNSTSSPDSGGDVYVKKAFNVQLSYSDRCTVLDSNGDGKVDNATCNGDHSQADWPDTPWDLSCASASGCTGSGHDAPAFFDTWMLTGITTNVEQGFNTPEPVDTWTLSYSWLAGDVNSDLVLASITHAGNVGSPDITLPVVSFGYTSKNNRVDYGEKDPNHVAYPSMQRWRLTRVTSETGAETDITYNPASCSATEQADPSKNTWPCFPQYWTAGDFGGSPTTLWFYKYTVARVVVNDGPDQGEPALDTHYTYCNDAACSSPGMGAAWHFDTDVDLVPEKDKSYGQWRGYQYVRVITGAATDIQSETDYTFLRGMYGDPLPGGGTDTSDVVTPSDTTGTQQASTSIHDVTALNGFQLEKITWVGLNGSSQGQLSDQVSWPWTSTTATSASEPWGTPLTAVLTRTAESDTYTPLSPRGNGGTAGTRQTQTASTFDPVTGLVTQVSDLGDLTQPSQAVCTTYVYPSPASAAGLLDYPAEVQKVNQACPGIPALVADSNPLLVSDTRYDYDGQASGIAPISGNVTETDVYSSGDSANGSPHWVKQSRDAYDSYGRLLSDQNAKGFTTTDWYCSQWSGATPACPAPGTAGYVQGYATTQTSVTSPLTSSTTATTTTDVNPEWGSPYDTIDPSGQRTDYAYDALGRVTSVWLPGQTQPSRIHDGLPNYTYLYNIDPKKAAPPSVATTRETGTNYVKVTSVAFFDSMLRPRQTQVPAEGIDGGIEVTDTLYDSRGNTVITNGPYPANTAPWSPGSATLPGLWNPTQGEGAIPDETQNTYDGAGRITSSSLFHDGALQWGTSWQYTGDDEVTKTPPPGGTITSTFTDARGRTTEIDQYHSKTQASGAYDATTYAYDPLTGKLDSVTDPGGNQWTWTYDLLGRQLTATTPDTGTTTSTYDDLSELTSVTDGASGVISYKYDQAGRKIAEYAAPYTGQNTGNQLAAWTYDTATLDNPALTNANAVGQLASGTSYVGGTGGEAYTKTISHYDPAYHPAQVTYTIPNNTVTGALGGTTTGGTAAYQYNYSYNVDRTPNTFEYPASGPLPDETVNYVYNSLGDQYSAYSTLADYATATNYTADAQPAEIDLGINTSAFWSRMLYSYDPASLRLTQTQIQNETTANNPAGANTWVTDDNITYAYDDAGNITSAGDSVTGNYQCYQYDYLSWLTAAWTQPTASCAATAPAPTGLGSGPAPYEQTQSYDNKGTANGSASGTTGNITGTTLTTIDGSGTATTTATTYIYPAYGTAQPHAPATESTAVNGGTPATTTLNWAASGSQPGYLATVKTGTATTASYNWDGTGARPGQLSSATTSGTTTSYRYDADGNLLIVKDGSTSTLYLPGQEITATSTAITRATRYYTADNQVIAVRTATSPTASTLDWLLPDPQGTATTLITSGTTPTPTHRYYTPYGDQLNTTPNWPGNRGYVGGTTDPATGLTNLGAREYNPALPAFISPDPILNPSDPADLNPYSYAYNNPATNSDPTGQLPQITCGAAGDCTNTQNPNQVIYGTGCDTACNQVVDQYTQTGNGPDYAAGLMSALHAIARPIISAIDGPQAGQAIDSFLSAGQAAFDQAAHVNVNTIAYGSGQLTPTIALAFAGGPEADITGVSDAGAPAVAPAVNAAGKAYPDVVDLRTGDPVPSPPSGLTKVPLSERVPWGPQQRGAFIKQWYDQGFQTPEGGWGQYDIHHIIPREYGGTNDFWNLTPVLRTVHQTEFNPWWLAYGG